MDMLKIFIIAATLEAIWETCKLFWDKGKLNIDRIGSAVLGIFFCLIASVDLFQLIHIYFNLDYVGMILSGLLISRGSNFLHDFICSIENIRSGTCK